MLLKAKQQAQKEAMAPLWDRVSEIIKEQHNVNLRPQTCRRRFFDIKANGAVVADGTQLEDEQVYQEIRDDFPLDPPDLDTPYVRVDPTVEKDGKQQEQEDTDVDSVVSGDEIQSALRDAEYEEVDINEPEQTIQGPPKIMLVDEELVESKESIENGGRTSPAGLLDYESDLG